MEPAQLSRALVGFAVFRQSPTSEQIQSFLDRAIDVAGDRLRYVVSDKGKQLDLT